MSVTPSSNDAVARIKSDKDAHSEEMNQLYQWIFVELPEHGPGLIQEKISNYNGVIPHRRWMAEAASMVAAAAAIESNSYVHLADLVAGLNGVKQEGTNWDDFGYQVTIRCLRNHAGQVNHFLLALLEKGAIEVAWILRYLSKESENVHVPENGNCTRLGNAICLAVFFAKELLAFNKKKFHYIWENLFSIGTNGKFLAEVISGLPPSYTKVNWEEFAQKRTQGNSGNEMLEAIKKDDYGEVQRLAGEEKPLDEIEIPFSLFEPYMHIDYQWVCTNERVGLSRPIKLMDAVGIFGAWNCFCGLCQLVEGSKLLPLLEECKSNLISGGSKKGFIDKMNDFGVNMTGCLKYAVRFHHNDAIDFLLNSAKQKDAVCDSAIAEASAAANFQALEQFSMQEGWAEYLKSGHLFHMLAIGNSAEFFALSLAELSGEFDPYAGGPTGCTFLHYAARYQSFEIFRLWCSIFGRVGLDAVWKPQSAPLNPAHVWRLYSICRPVPSKQLTEFEKSPEYAYIFKRTSPDYDVSKDEKPDE